MGEKLPAVKRDLRSSLVTNKEAVTRGISAAVLLSDYKACMFGEKLPYKELGFRDLEAFCRSIPDVVSVIRGAEGPLYKLVSSTETANIEKLVAKQVSKKKQGSRKQASRQPQRRPVNYSTWKSPTIHRPSPSLPGPGQSPMLRAAPHVRPAQFQQRYFIRRGSASSGATVSPVARTTKPVAWVSPTQLSHGGRGGGWTPSRTVFGPSDQGRIPGSLSVTVTKSPEVKFGENYEVPPRFRSKGRTVQVGAAKPGTTHQDFKILLNQHAHVHPYLKPVEFVSRLAGSQTEQGWLSHVILNGKNYPVTEAHKTKRQAEQAAAMTVCQELRLVPNAPGSVEGDVLENRQSRDQSRDERSQPMRASSPGEEEIKSRVSRVLQKKGNGLWNTRLVEEYKEMFGEEAPHDLLFRISAWSDIVQIEDVQGTERKILYPVTQTSHRLVQSRVVESLHIPPADLPAVGSKLQAYTCFVRDPGHFYVQRADSPIEQLQLSISETYGCRGSPKELQNAQPGTYCMSKFDNAAWYRARIISADTKREQVYYEVFYVDFGNTETVSHMRVRRLLDTYAQPPAQAIKCRLANVAPKGSKWTAEETKGLSQIYDFSQEVLLNVLAIEDDCCEVLLYDGKEVGRCLNDVLIEKGIVVDTSLPAEPELLELPADDVWDVFVSYVETACDVTIRLVGEEYSWKLEAVEERLSALEDAKFETGEPRPNSLVAAKVLEDGEYRWFRCRVVGLTSQRVRVHFLDHDDEETVDLENLRPLHPEYNQLPYQAVSCKLTGLEPYADDERMLSELRACALGKTLVCELDERLDTIKVTLYDTSSDEDVNLNQKISQVLMLQDLAPKIPPENETIEGFVSHVTDEGRLFFNIQGPGLQKLEEMLVEIDQIYATINASLLMLKPEVGKECVAKYSEANVEGWYRAVIHELYPSMRKAGVYFVDYGNSEIISYANLRVYSTDSKYLKRLPFQAIECELYGLPPPGGVWSREACQRVRELCPLDELRILEVVKHPSTGLPQVEVYFQKKRTLIAVSEVLIEERIFYSMSDEDNQIAATRHHFHDEDKNLGNSAGTSNESGTRQDVLSRGDSPRQEQRTSPLRVDVAVARKYASSQRVTSPKSDASPTSVMSARSGTSSGLSSPRTPTSCVWADEVKTPDISPSYPNILRSPRSPRSPDDLPHGPISPGDNRKVIEYEDMLSGYDAHMLDEAYSCDETSPSAHRETAPMVHKETPPSAHKETPSDLSAHKDTAETESGKGKSFDGSPNTKPLKGILKRKTDSPSQCEEQSLEIQVIGGDEFLLENSELLLDNSEAKPLISEEYRSSHASDVVRPATVASPRPTSPVTAHDTKQGPGHPLAARDDPIIDLDALSDSDDNDPIVDLDESEPANRSDISCTEIYGNSDKVLESPSDPSQASVKKNISFSEHLESLIIISDDEEDAKPDEVEPITDCDVTESLVKVELPDAGTEGACSLASSVAAVGEGDMPPALTLPQSGDELFITWVENPHNFRCIPQASMEELRELTEAMYVFYNEHSHEVDYQVSRECLDEGQLYAGLHDKLWYRVVVKKVIFNQVAIHFVDYGDFTVMPISCLRVLTSCFQLLPFQAIKARLAGVESIEENWSDEACNRFSDLIVEQTLTAFIHASQDKEFVCLTLVDTSKEAESQFIHKVLLREKLAKKPEPLAAVS